MAIPKKKKKQKTSFNPAGIEKAAHGRSFCWEPTPMYAHALKVASRKGLAAQSWNTSLRTLPMTHKTGAAECPWALAQIELGIGRGPRLVSRIVQPNAALAGT